MQPPLEPYGCVRLEREVLAIWSYFDSSMPVLHNTDLLFLHALRPYWEHYLGRVTFIELEHRSALESADLATRALLEQRFAGGGAFASDSQVLDREAAIRAAEGSVALLASDATIEPLRARVAGLVDRPMLEIVLAERIARLEVEPAWRRIASELTQPTPRLVLFSLGWESVVFATRLVDSLGISAVDAAWMPSGQRRFFWGS